MTPSEEVRERAEAVPGVRRFHGLTPRSLLIAVCATSVAPAIAAAFGAGVPSAELSAVVQWIGSIGGGVVSTALMDAISRLRARNASAALTTADVEKQVVGSFELTLPADLNPRSLDVQIAEALQQINGAEIIAGVLRASGDWPAFGELVTALSSLRDSYPLALEVLDDGFSRVLQNQDMLGQDMQEVLAQLAELRRELGHVRFQGSGGTSSLPAAGGRSGRWAYTCPYPGLKSFSELDSPVFYGRERRTAELIGRLTDAQHREILIVTGASGAGKTSLLQAGLLPALQRGEQVRGSDRWPRKLLTLAADPLGQFAQVLATLGGDDPNQVRERLAGAPGKANLVVRQALDRLALHYGRTAGSGRLVLVIDQFEDFFELNLDQRQAAEFITALHSAAADPTEPDGLPPAVIAIAIRLDRIDRCVAHAELRRSAEVLFIVEPMDDGQLRRAIIDPAVKAGLNIEDELVEDVLGDVDAIPREGVLPLLSEAMRRTWEEHTGSWLTRDGYHRGGGVKGAAQASAQAVIERIGTARETLARDILVSMTEVRQGQTIRRPTTLARIVAAHPDDKAAVGVVLDVLCAGRLIVVGADHVQIVHDVLLEVWPQLKDWLNEDLQNYTAYRQFQDDADLWTRRGNDRAYLYRGIRLATLREAMPAWPPDRYVLTEDDREFLQASEKAAALGTRLRRLTEGMLASLLVLSVTVALFAWRQDIDASQQRQLALSGQLAALSEEQDGENPVVAALLAAAAWKEAQTEQARESLLQVLAQPVRAVMTAGGPIKAAAFSPRHDVLATAGKAVVFWNLATNRPIGSPVTVPGGATGVAFNRAGTVLATADADGTTRLWDISTGKETGAPIAASAGSVVNAVAFSPDGDVLATADGDSTARLWSVSTHREIGHSLIDGGHIVVGDQVTDVTFSPDGKFLATASMDGTARLWDVATQRQSGRALISKQKATALRQMVAVAFSPRGNVLATADLHGTLSLWNVATRQPDGAPMLAKAGADDIAFSPDGSALAVADIGGAAEIWDLRSRTVDLPVDSAASAGSMSAVAFSPGHTLLATVSQDGTARLWDLVRFHNVTPATLIGTGVAISRDARIIAGVDPNGTVRLWNMVTGRAGAPIGAGGVSAAALSPDGRILATGGDDGTVRLWNAHTGQQFGKVIAVSGTAGVSAVAFSPDGQLLATGDDNGKVRLWNARTSRPAGRTVPGGPAAVNSLTFSPNGTMLAITDSHRNLRLWNAVSGQPIGRSITLAVAGVAFSPNGQDLATADADGTARLWRLATGRQIGIPMAGTDEGAVSAVAFSPDGALLATAGADSDAGLWDVATQRLIGTPVSGGASVSSLSMVAFSTDGKLLTTVAQDGVAAIWNIAFPPDLYDAVCDIADRPFTRQEWSSYVPSAPYLAGCLPLPRVRSR